MNFSHLFRASALTFALNCVVRAEDAPAFTKEIRPILEKNCFECHGEKKQKGGLRLDRRADILQGGDSAKAPFEPGKSDASDLILRVLSDDADEKMPPKGERLPAEEIAKLKAWINAGALIAEDGSGQQAKHWAYVKPEPRPLPEVQNAAWTRGGLDRWILARLEKEGLAPSPEADRAGLLRRVSLDLTGLPPTLAEVDAFLADAAPDAYEKVVERLLAAPAYGERWARPWLDLARYADTQGYEKDNRRSIWPYRDWLIGALNRDEPFDQFTIEQIAGDLLPNATQEQKVATGFHRNTMTNTEGGTDNEEFRYEALVDRVNTTFGAWMGTTMACAQCHNHKYDPILTKEYYQAMAFLNNTADADNDDESPTMKVVTPEQQAALEKLQAAQRDAEKAVADFANTPAFAAAQTAWERDATSLPPDVASLLTRTQRDDKQQARVNEYFRFISPELQPLTAAARAAKSAAEDFNKALPFTSVMAELPKPRVTKRHVRGAFLSVAEEVQPGTPGALHAFPKDAPANRLGFAQWLVDRENPLTARVMANRAWEQFFGTGIVETVEEFGKQGEAPSHPELLDWLALQLMDGSGSGKPWSVKALHRLIVLSTTYRQSSKVPAELRERDPANRLLARGPRVRLEAEMIRDQALAAAGLLSPKVGGPSVMPPQPGGIWQMVYSGDDWKLSSGEDKYRRGLYTFYRRSSPYPMMASFDAPSREFCVLRRNRSNTPLQALNTLNDPAFVEAAQALARKIAAVPDDLSARAEFAFRSVLTRSPKAEETARVLALFESERATFTADPAAAEKMACSEIGNPPEGQNIPELAAWTVVANILLNLDEAITKG